MTVMEHILTETDDFTDIIHFPTIFQLYKKHERYFWTLDNFHFEDDISDWNNKLTKDQRYFLMHILAFFARADLIVGQNLMNNFCNEVKIKESVTFYTFQAAMENIHNQTYMRMITCFVPSSDDRQKLFNAHKDIPCIKKKAEWAQKWMATSRPFAERLIAFICIEGIHFCSSFAGIFWFKDMGLMANLCKSNEYISRDESLHVIHGMELFKLLQHKPSTEVIHRIMREAVDLECEFSQDAIPCKFIGLNSDAMITYIKFITNQYLTYMDVPTLYSGVSNPFSFMDKINAKIQVDFFMHENADYSMAKNDVDDGVYEAIKID
jgi:ribonucleoside-diphosphate reductase subunit M2